MKEQTERPKMTIGRAAVLGLMSRYQVPGYDYLMSLLEVQKLAYFLQDAGERLRLKYVKHLYGPYADNLRHVLRHIEGHFILGKGWCWSLLLSSVYLWDGDVFVPYRAVRRFHIFYSLLFKEL